MNTVQPNIINQPKRADARRNIRGVGSIVFSKLTNRFLFALRAISAGKPHEWNFWGGIVGQSEQPSDGIVRLTKRQSGYRSYFTDTIQLHTFENPASNFRYYNYVLVVDDEFIPTFDTRFIDNFIWVDYGEWPDPMYSIAKDILRKSDSRIKDIVEKNRRNEKLH